MPELCWQVGPRAESHAVCAAESAEGEANSLGPQDWYKAGENQEDVHWLHARGQQIRAVDGARGCRKRDVLLDTSTALFRRLGGRWRLWQAAFAGFLFLF